jgi:membrane protein YdbS with pleckstrin-like domain
MALFKRTADTRSSAVQAPLCPHCGQPLPPGFDAPPPREEPEELLYEASPAMFLYHPFIFTLCFLLSVLGVGLVVLLIWRIRARSVRLIVTNRRIILYVGIFSRTSVEIPHADVREIFISQTFLERLRGVGTLEIAGPARGEIEIAIDGLRDPQGVAALIRDCQE